MKEILHAIPKYSGRDDDDLSLWQDKVLMYLSTKDLEVYVESKVDTKAADEKRNDRKAKAIVCMCLADNITASVIKMETAFEVWQFIENTFRKKSRSTRTRLIKEFWELKKGDNNIANYVSEVGGHAAKLKAIGKKVSEEDVIDKVLSGLPTEYDPLLVNLDHAQTELKLQDLVSSLVNYESQLAHRERESSEHLILQAKAKHGSWCELHKTTRHDSRSCWILHPELRPKRFQNHDKLPTANSNYQISSAFNRKIAISDWLIDSGSSLHLCKNPVEMTNVHSSPAITVTVANNDTIELTQVGSAKPNLMPQLDRVYFSKIVNQNLLSVGECTNQGFSFVFKNHSCKVLDPNDRLVCEAIKDQNNLYSLKASAASVLQTATYSMKDENNIDIWHARMGHPNDMSLTQLLRNHNINISNPKMVKFCDGCLQGKMARGIVPKVARFPATRPLETIHSDICEPFPESLHHRIKFFITFLDEYSRHIMVFGLKQKSDAQATIERYIRISNTKFCHIGHRVQAFQSDNGSEYISKRVQELFGSLGIVHRTSIAYQPEQNGMAERINRTIIESAHCMRISANLPKDFWWLAVTTAVHVINRRPHSRLSQSLTPHFLWTGQKESLQELRVFGCDAFVHTPKQIRQKLEPRAKKMIFVGYPAKHKGYQFWDPSCFRLIACRFSDATFNEKSFTFGREQISENDDEVLQLQVDFERSASNNICPEQSETVDPMELEPVEPAVDNSSQKSRSFDEDISDDDDHEMSSEKSQGLDSKSLTDDESDRLSSTSSDYTLPETQQVTEPQLRRSTREHEPPREWWKVFATRSGFDEKQASSIPVPNTYHEATHPKNAYRAHWQKAIDAEFMNLSGNNTWALCSLPEGRKAISCKWVFKVKSKEDGSIDKFKARLVVRGFSQRPGIDFDETFSPVARLDTVRMMFALSAQENLTLQQLDIVGAFLQSNLQEEIFMEQPEGLESGNPRQVCKLLRSLYGLKQAGRVWNSTINTFLTDHLGLTRSSRQDFYTSAGSFRNR